MNIDMKEFVSEYQILVSVVIAWLTAQVLKTLIYFYLEKEFRVERLVGSGGMPSSHSATVCALAVTSGLLYSIRSFEFSVSLVLAIIVMHDAMNVRLETGKQAKVINALVREGHYTGTDDVFSKNLKELIGHTPTQVVCGGLLGIAVAFIVDLLAGM